MNRCMTLCPALLLAVLVSPAWSADTIPDYKVVPGWPRIPADVKLGPVSAVATDSADRVYVGHRAKHTILVFDKDGTFLRSWGDDHIKTVHGVRIDPEGKV